jgi:hypothetical protein
MRARIWAIDALCAGVAVAAGTGSARSEAATSCRPGMTTFAGVSARVFCGPATVTVQDGSTTFTIKGGSCRKTGESLAVNIGEVVLGVVNKPQPDYFGLAVGSAAAKDGTYHSGVVGVVHAGKGYPLRANATTVLKSERSRGSFTASSLRAGTISGSFTC